MNSPIEVIHADAASNPNRYGGTAGIAGAHAIEEAAAPLRGEAFARLYGAHFLQEVAIAQGDNMKPHKVAVSGILRALQFANFNAQDSALRFEKKNDTFHPHFIAPTLTDISKLPKFALGNEYANNTILYVGMGGGSDVIQAAAVAKLVEQQAPGSTAGIASIRSGKRHLVNADQLDPVTWQVSGDTRPDGDWRFLETIPFETDPHLPLFLINDHHPGIVKIALQRLARRTGAHMIIGVDTGGDGLATTHTSFSAPYGTLAKGGNQDAQIVSALANLEHENLIARTFTVAPGIDSPANAASLFAAHGARRWELTAEERDMTLKNYAAWRMDGSGNNEGRYGKTNLAWLGALRGERGLHALNLPAANITHPRRPWRSFLTLTDPMADIVVMDARKHADALRQNS